MPGKVKAVAGQKLKPENVCWDLTAGVDQTSGTNLPLLFMTGYKVHYVPGGSAVPLHGLPQYGHAVAQAFWEKWLGFPPRIAYEPFNGIPAFYSNHTVSFRTTNSTVAPDGSIPNFVPPDFKPDGRTYRQLTPDGMLQ